MAVTYDLYVEPAVHEARKALPGNVRQRVRGRIEALASAPRARQSALGGLQEMSDQAVFRVSPFREMGEARGVLRRFGGDPRRFRAAMNELQRRLYADAALG